MPYAVFQRSTSNTARIPIAGRTKTPVAVVEARVTLMRPYESGVDGKAGEFATIARPSTASFAGGF